MANYTKFSADNSARLELKDKLGLTGCEISVNKMPKGQEVPFIHSHKENEEVYIILEGEGSFKIDNEIVDFKKGDILRLSSVAKRQMKATSDIKYICIQCKENSLLHWTASDAEIIK